MWTFDTQGRLYSAVAHQDDAELVVVRSRVRSDAEHLNDALRTMGAPSQVVVYERSDYPIRVITTKVAWAEHLAAQAVQIDYPNYKAHVMASADHAAQRHAVLHDVWAAGLRLEQIDRPAARWDEDWDDQPDAWVNADGVSLDDWLDPFYAGEPSSLAGRYRDWRTERAEDEALNADQAAAEGDPWGDQ